MLGEISEGTTGDSEELDSMVGANVLSRTGDSVDGETSGGITGKSVGDFATVGNPVGPNKEIGRVGTSVEGKVGTWLLTAPWGASVGTPGS